MLAKHKSETFQSLIRYQTQPIIWKLYWKNVLLYGLMTDCLCKVSKILAELSEVFNFENFLIYVMPKFDWNLKCVGCYFYFLIGNLTQNGRFSNVNNEFNETNVRN